MSARSFYTRAVVGCFCFYGACAWACQPQVVDRFLPQTDYQECVEQRAIDTIIIHTSCYMPELDAAIERISDDIYSLEGLLQVWHFYHVGPHYAIDREGTIYRTVLENTSARHAGCSVMPQPDGRSAVNTFSIGIELINDERHTITQEQYCSLVWLIKDIQARHPITHVLGHSMVSAREADKKFGQAVSMIGALDAMRKTDPWGLDWHYLNLLYHNRVSQYKPDAAE